MFSVFDGEDDPPRRRSRDPTVMTSDREGEPGIPRRHSSQSSSAHSEDLIRGLEAEEERLVLSLTRKLEQIRREKVQLESVHGAESEALYNRLQTLQLQLNGSEPTSPGIAPGLIADPYNPPAALVVERLKTENHTLRERLADVETDAVKQRQQNDSMRAELIELRSRLGLDVGDLVGFSPPGQSRAIRSGSRSGAIAIPGAVAPSSFSALYHQNARGRGSSRSTTGAGSSSASPPTTASRSPTDSPRMRVARLGDAHTSTVTTPSTSYVPAPPFPTPYASPPAGHFETGRRAKGLEPTRPPPPSLSSSVSSTFTSPLDRPPYSPAAPLDESAISEVSTPLSSQSPRSSRSNSLHVAESGMLPRARGASNASSRP